MVGCGLLRIAFVRGTNDRSEGGWTTFAWTHVYEASDLGLHGTLVLPAAAAGIKVSRRWPRERVDREAMLLQEPIFVQHGERVGE